MNGEDAFALRARFCARWFREHRDIPENASVTNKNINLAGTHVSI